MAEKEEKSNNNSYAYIAIVAIVAIVALVVLIVGGSKTAVVSGEDLTGQAIAPVYGVSEKGGDVILKPQCTKPGTSELCIECCKGWGPDCLVNCGMGIASNWSYVN
jgi:hypothetical protein